MYVSLNDEIVFRLVAEGRPLQDFVISSDTRHQLKMKIREMCRAIQDYCRHNELLSPPLPKTVPEFQQLGLTWNTLFEQAKEQRTDATGWIIKRK